LQELQQRASCLVHFKSPRRIKNLTDVEAEAAVGQCRETQSKSDNSDGRKKSHHIERPLSLTDADCHLREPNSPPPPVAPVVDNQNTMTAGPRGPQLMQDVWLLEKLATLTAK
jgi:hypothetical protein